MRDSCLRRAPWEGRIALRLSPQLAALLLHFDSRECDATVEVTLPAARARRLRRSLPDARPREGEADAAAPALAALQLALTQALSRQAPAGGLGHPALTAREREVLAALSAGDSYAEIARDLVIDVETVRSHAKRVRRKLGVSSSSELRGWSETKVAL